MKVKDIKKLANQYNEDRDIANVLKKFLLFLKHKNEKDKLNDLEFFYFYKEIRVIKKNDFKMGVKSLLSQNAIFNDLSAMRRDSFLQLTSIIDCLSTFKLADPSHVKLFMNHLERYDINNILGLLSKNTSLILKKPFLNLLLQEKIHFDCSDIYEYIDYLDQSNLLNQQTVDFALQFTDIRKQRLFQIFDTFSNHELFIDKNTFNLLTNLSVTNLKRIDRIVRDLDQNKLLNWHNVSLAIERLKIKLPVQEINQVKKLSRKKTHSPRSEFIIDDRHHLFIQHSELKQYLSGGYGKVKKAYQKSNDKKPSHSIKKIFNEVVSKPEKEAERECKYNQLLNRETFFFKHNDSYYLAAKWQKGRSLFLYNQNEFTNITQKTKIICIIIFLEELNKLHSHSRVHGDIKLHNVILDLINKSMHLIDFGTSRKCHSEKEFAHTAYFSDFNGNHSKEYGFYNDVYSAGIVISYLYPEFFTHNDSYSARTVTPNKIKNIRPEQRAIIDLIAAMMHEKKNARCTVFDALNYLNEIQTTKELTFTKLTKIQKATIMKNEVTPEDVFRERTCPMRLYS